MATEIVFLLDKSGSMFFLEGDVIGGFNSFISEQKKLQDEAYLTTVLFDTTRKTLHESVNIQHVEPITAKDYHTGGGTALLDAFGNTILSVKSRTRKKDKVLFVINTDGEENSSIEFDNEKIKKLVKECEEKRNWKFIFIGANIDSFSVGGNMGITYTTNYTPNSVGQASVYTAVTEVTTQFRGSKDAFVNTDSLKSIK